MREAVHVESLISIRYISNEVFGFLICDFLISLYVVLEIKIGQWYNQDWNENFESPVIDVLFSERLANKRYMFR